MRDMCENGSKLPYLPRWQAVDNPRVSKLAWISLDGVKFLIAHTDRRFVSKVFSYWSIGSRCHVCSDQNCVFGSNMLSDDRVVVCENIFTEWKQKSSVRCGKLNETRKTNNNSKNIHFVLYVRYHVCALLFLQNFDKQIDHFVVFRNFQVTLRLLHEFTIPIF